MRRVLLCSPSGEPVPACPISARRISGPDGTSIVARVIHTAQSPNGLACVVWVRPGVRIELQVARDGENHLGLTIDRKQPDHPTLKLIDVRIPVGVLGSVDESCWQPRSAGSIDCMEAEFDGDRAVARITVDNHDGTCVLCELQSSLGLPVILSARNDERQAITAAYLGHGSQPHVGVLVPAAVFASRADSRRA